MSDSGTNNENTLAALAADYSTLVHIDAINDNAGMKTGTVADGGLTDDLTPTLTGRLPGGTGLELRVFVNGSVNGYTTVDTEGNWTYTPRTPLEPGMQYDFQVYLLDPGSGNTLYPSNLYTVHTTEPDQDADTAPTAPVIDTVVDDVQGGIKGNLHNGNATNDARPALTGHAEAGSVVNIYDNGVLLGSVKAAADGKWAFTPAADLNDGAHSLTATAVNAAGESVPTTGFDITVDTQVSAPIITRYHDDVGTQQGDVTSGGRTDDNNGLLSGHAEAGSVVSLTMWGPRGVRYANVGSAVADSNGEWHIQLSDTTRLLGTKGTWTFQTTATDAAGNSATGDKFTVKYVGSNQDDTTAPDAPVITYVYDDVGSSTGNLSNGATTDDTQPALSGTAEANSVVKIYDNGQVIGSVNTNSSGHWSYTPSARGEGSHTFTATATDTAGNVSGKSAGFVVNIEPAQVVPVIVEAADNVGKGAYIHSGDTTDDTTPVLHGNAEPGSAVKIYDNGQLIGSVTANNTNTIAGGWSFTPSARAEGSHTFTVTATDSAGNVSDKSAGFVMDIDHTGTVKPTVTSTSDDVGGQHGVVLMHAEDTHGAVVMSDSALMELSTAMRVPGQADTTDHQQNTLQLTLNDILNEAHDNLFIQDGNKQLAITGDAGDVVELKVADISHDWQDSGKVTAGGVEYEVYQHADLNVELLVQNGVELHQTM